MRFSLGTPKRVALLGRALVVALVVAAGSVGGGGSGPAYTQSSSEDLPVEVPMEVPVEVPGGTGADVPVEPPVEAPLEQPLPESPVLVAPPAPVNPRYGVVYTRALPPEQIERFQREFGAAAWLDMNAGASPIPGKVPLLPLNPTSRLSGEQLAALVLQYPPGTAWYVGGEANVPSQGNTTGAEYAAYFHDAAATIRAVDPTARVMAASVLNFVDTCGGCAGYTPGWVWVEEFRNTHLALYGEEPAVDVWALDSYLLDWNNLPMIDAAFLPRQVTALRQYLDAVPGQAGKPIWVTEFGVVWAYESLRWVEIDGIANIIPARAFRADLLESWLSETMSWLETEGVALGVERWFLFGTLAPPGEPWYTGIQLLEPAEEGHRLSALGAQYAAAARASAPTPDTVVVPEVAPEMAPEVAPDAPAPVLSAQTGGE